MDRDLPEKPASPPPVEELEFEVVEEGAPRPSAASHATEALVGAFRVMVKQRLRRWALGAAIWGTLLGWLAIKSVPARWFLGLFILWKLLTLAFLLYGLWASRRHSHVLIQTFLRGANRPGP